MEEKMGIKETMEVLIFATSVVGDLAKAKSDDGKISLWEWGQTIASNSPAALKAAEGLEKVDDEMKDLDEEEIKRLAVAGLALAKAVMGLVKSSKKPE